MVRAYERLRHISTGRFGASYLVQSRSGLAMMKTIDIGRLDSTSRKEVVDEVTKLSNLRHPHLTAMHESFVEGGHLCLVLQYAGGGHAAGQIDKARRTCTALDESLVLKWFTQASLGLKHMHDRSVIHRDLRTRRLLINVEGDVILSGAALTALLRSSLHQERPDLEALRYLSPELVDGKGHTLASDMWAMGAILYELASLSPPFDHPHPRGLAERILSGPPRSLPPSCSKEVQDLCAQLMQRRPEDRLTSTATLCNAIIQNRLCKLFDEEPAFVPGATTSLRALSSRQMATVASPSGGHTFAPLLQRSPMATPRGLRRIGEQVTGVKCGAVGVSGSTAFRRPSYWNLMPNEVAAEAESGSDAYVYSKPPTPALQGHRKTSKRITANSIQSFFHAPEKIQQVDPVKITNQMASEHAKAYAGIMVETALEELNFSSSRLLEEDVPFGQFSLPTAVDDSRGVTWSIDKELAQSDVRETPRTWDKKLFAHEREFPRFG